MLRSTKVTESTIHDGIDAKQKKCVRFAVVAGGGGGKEENESNQPKLETVHVCDALPTDFYGDYFWSEKEIDSILQRELSFARDFVGNAENKALIDCIYYLLGYDVENRAKVDEETDPQRHKRKLEKATRRIAESGTFGLEKKMIPLFTAHRSWAVKEIMKSKGEDSGVTSMNEASRRVSHLSCGYAQNLARGMEQFIRTPVVKKTHKVPIKMKHPSNAGVIQPTCVVPPHRPQTLRKRISVTRNTDSDDDDATLLVAPKQHRKGVSCCG